MIRTESFSSVAFLSTDPTSFKERILSSTKNKFATAIIIHIRNLLGENLLESLPSLQFSDLVL